MSNAIPYNYLPDTAHVVILDRVVAQQTRVITLMTEMGNYGTVRFAPPYAIHSIGGKPHKIMLPQEDAPHVVHQWCFSDVLSKTAAIADAEAEGKEVLFAIM